MRGTETILLVEDEEQVRNLARMFLEECGYTVLVACNGPDAIQLARQYDGKIQLLITDVIMPEMKGSVLAPLLLAHRPGIRVLYMSGYADTEFIRKELMPEGAHFLQKPFSLESLSRKVREVLDSPASGLDRTESALEAQGK
jgi:DNA-binding NtrC family response regulator